MEVEKELTEQCCVISCNMELGKSYWNNQYKANNTGWDLGEVSPPLKAYIDQLSNKEIRILIPGCGNTYEAQYLLQQGFTNITLIDIAPALVKQLKIKFKANAFINIIPGDFFELSGTYDLILEQTFFCAIPISLRKQYVTKMKDLLASGGKLVGVLFNREFEQQGPPFGGCKCQYEPLFSNNFEMLVFDKCYNSFYKRKDTELFMILQKK
ncbi:methyltransferase domain-containing protein [soil metagenome]